MIKKRQNLTRWLILTGILALQMGCAAIEPAQVKKSAANESKKSANKPVKSQVKSKAITPKPGVAQTKPEAKVNAEVKSELSGEIFYYLLSAEIAVQRGQIGLAAALYTKAAIETRDPRVAQQATRISYYTRDDKRAIAAAQLWHELEPTNLEARQVLAALLVRIGKATEAAEHFEYVLNNGKNSERKRFMLITSLLSKEKDKNTALAVMQKLIAKRNNNPHALYAYSQLAFLSVIYLML